LRCTRWAVLASIAILSCSTPVRAQGETVSSGGPYVLSAVAVSGGGGPIASGPYQFTSTIGQPATSTLSGGSYVLSSGFWAVANGEFDDSIFSDGFDD
jgi:hypothetical protein